MSYALLCLAKYYHGDAYCSAFSMFMLFIWHLIDLRWLVRWASNCLLSMMQNWKLMLNISYLLKYFKKGLTHSHSTKLVLKGQNTRLWKEPLSYNYSMKCTHGKHEVISLYQNKNSSKAVILHFMFSCTRLIQVSCGLIVAQSLLNRRNVKTY